MATYMLWGTWLRVPALVNLILTFWSLGVLSNYRGAPVSGSYERIVGALSMITSVVSVGLLVTAIVFAFRSR